uniref:Uncharacterized protein n=1 Tax=uncultured marine virus TaxID=186617 RepID=A0A0F7L5N8_9VIRU|nr:hypothetical protein [uncultured marine virus]
MPGVMSPPVLTQLLPTLLIVGVTTSGVLLRLNTSTVCVAEFVLTNWSPTLNLLRTELWLVLVAMWQPVGLKLVP